jgi:hypothetical protein
MKSIALCGYLKMGTAAMAVKGLTEFSYPKDKVRRRIFGHVSRLLPGDRLVEVREFKDITKINIKEYQPVK